MKNFKIGDRVKCLGPTDCKEEIVGEYGTIIYIGDIDMVNMVGVEFDNNVNGHDGTYWDGKDGHCWNCDINSLEKISETKLEDITLQKGDILYFEDNTKYVINDLNGHKVSMNGSVIKVERPTEYTTIYESPKNILDKEEKKYLSDVVRPFKNKVTSIVKIYFGDIDKEYIKIKTGKCRDYASLPYFKKGTMYKGMEPNKEYTLKELGL